jgi:DNA-binding transcriptional ArsR family regulator
MDSGRRHPTEGEISTSDVSERYRKVAGAFTDRVVAVRPEPETTRLTGKYPLALWWRVVEAFKALADVTRRAVLDELTDRDGQTLFELCVRLSSRHGIGSSRQAISQHLDVLEAAGLVTTKRQSRYKYHYIDTAPLRAIVERWPITEREDSP